MRRTVRWAGALLAMGLFAACSPGEGVDRGGKDGSGVVAAIAGEPDQLDPHRTSAYFSFEVLENTFDTLVEPDGNLQMRPALAKRWKASKDELTWTFTLRDGVTWHDGSKFSADDVVYSYKRIIDKKLGNAWRFEGVKDITAPDRSTVVIKLKEPMTNLLSRIGGHKGLAIVQKKNVESGKISKRPIGTGPFSVEDYKPGESIKLKANSRWWGGAPKIPSLTFRFIPEPTTALADLRAGEIDWTDNLPPQQVKKLSADDSLKLDSVVSNDYWYLSANEKRKPFDDPRVRQAIAYGIDREAITKATQYGNATVNQLAIPKTNPWYTQYSPYSHDTDRASELLDDAGVTDLKIDMLVTKEYPETVTAGQLIASQLKKVGITVKPREVDFATWLDKQGKGQYDMLMLGWLGNLDPDQFYYAQHHSKGNFNFQKYSDSKVDKLLEAGRSESDEKARKALYAEAARKIADDASYIYLYNPDVVHAWDPKLKGYKVRSDSAIRFRDAELTD
ncbi:ABC transporter substrate-binding protein [Streptomyces sp. WMMB 322]|uniref:ABC transporter substrate-binding protein n=1 Tax=Streptomyces sp. WMMB 322 TaxID=1286821 RepID=UPI0006E37A92|nr:ABC transporter substrate-binding protein [Streptomyces sp. WMMB 322]SCK26068.1 peptide/nickel transport system substrate-binding protein [Streptomyces sp. WMMB 322]